MHTSKHFNPLQRNWDFTNLEDLWPENSFSLYEKSISKVRTSYDLSLTGTIPVFFSALWAHGKLFSHMKVIHRVLVP